MLSPYQFILRTFQQPEGFEIPIISGDDFTDAQISNLYYYFMCCFCQRFYNEYTAQLKKGCKPIVSCKTKYLLMSLYVLRNYYNQSNYTFTFPIIYNSFSGNCDMSIWLTPTYGIFNNPTAIAIFPPSSVQGTNSNEVLSSLISFLPDNYTPSISGVNQITITVSEPLPALPFILVGQAAPVTGVVDEWFPLNFNPCLSQENAESIIENCIEICGIPNCANESSLMNDSNYVSLPLMWNTVSDAIQTYLQEPNIYFQ